MIYYVNQSAPSFGAGTPDCPFRTIGEAAALAHPGDEVWIGEGIYRETVSPVFGGLDDQKRITYRNQPGTRPVISGAEPITDWARVSGDIWRASVPNTLFGSGTEHPYLDPLGGDWHQNGGQVHHRGEVFLDGEALFEVNRMEKLETPAEGERARRWYAQVDEANTVFYVNFGGVDPNGHTTEISVRRMCFFPEQTGVNYITVSGLEMAYGADQWAPPTAFQEGLIGTHWSRGWIIENCRIHHAKCAGISLGKKREWNDNYWTNDRRKDGSQIFMEMVCANLEKDWNQAQVGGHLIRNCEIYACGQTGIVGNMGGAFSVIRHNHIHHVADREEFAGPELGGIKLHAPIDTVIEDNIIHHCCRGIFLDWEVQGIVIRRNVLFENVGLDDLFIEVSHGPGIIENNIFLSPYGFGSMSEGYACVHNLFACKLFRLPEYARFTFYHRPHSTALSGVSMIFGGDDRFFNNLFLYSDRSSHWNERCGLWEGSTGTAYYEGCRHEPIETMTEADRPTPGNQLTFPVRMADNLYGPGTEAWSHERNPMHTDEDLRVDIIEKDGHIFLKTNIGEVLYEFRGHPVDGHTLGRAFQPDQAFENPDGSFYRADTDFWGQKRSDRPCVGPFESLPASGVIRLI